jgi:hypothetical protein
MRTGERGAKADLIATASRTGGEGGRWRLVLTSPAFRLGNTGESDILG